MSSTDRLKQIEELEEFIKEKHQVLSGILNTLEWTQESLVEEVKVCCPINPEHWFPKSALPKHLEACKWAKNGYVKEELKMQPPDSSFFYEKSSNVVSVPIDHAIIEKVLSENGLINKYTGYDSGADLPQTFDRWTVHFSPEQRLAIYNHIVEVSKESRKTKNVTVEDLMIDFEKKDNDEEKPKSHLEILAEMRDYKRRRQSYRAKNVHITKKSYTEVMKEVIENQTNYLAEIRKVENNDNSNTDHEDSLADRQNHCGDADYNSSDDSPRHKEHHSRHRRDKDGYRKRHHSKHKSSKNYSPKRKKHKDRSRSRSPSHHKHKKSHKKKRSHD